MLGHPVITSTTLVWLGRLKGKMFVPFNLFLRLTDISLRLTIQPTKFSSTVGALLGSNQLFDVVDDANGNSWALSLSVGFTVNTEQNVEQYEKNCSGIETHTIVLLLLALTEDRPLFSLLGKMSWPFVSINRRA
jgi:hypothetical protein